MGSCPDMDNDGHRAAACGGDDCDDNNARRDSGAREVCDGEGLDEDCDPCTVGEVLPGQRGGDSDRDDDGFPSRACFNRVAMGQTPMCAPLLPPDGGMPFERVTVTDTEVRGRDCDDSSLIRNPASSERCDERLVDENCNGTVNEGCDCPTPTAPEVSRACMGAMGECARGNQTCTDGRWSMCSIAPAAQEVCDGRDDNCDGTVDEGLRTNCFRDVDGDGLAAAGSVTSMECGVRNMAGALECPAGFTATAPAGRDVDCDDTVATGIRRSPRLMEVPCNSIDDDCNAATTDLCPGGQACGAAGMCGCPAGQQFCGGRCQTAGACTRSTGTCTTNGTWVCGGTGVVTCSAPAPMVGTEVPCNGLDENCNGPTDDSNCGIAGQSCNASRMCACPTGQAPCGTRCQPSGACTAGAGTCQRGGTYVCNGGTSTSSCNAVAAAPSCSNGAVCAPCAGSLVSGTQNCVDACTQRSCDIPGGYREIWRRWTDDAAFTHGCGVQDTTGSRGWHAPVGTPVGCDLVRSNFVTLPAGSYAICVGFGWSNYSPGRAPPRIRLIAQDTSGLHVASTDYETTLTSNYALPCARFVTGGCQQVRFLVRALNFTQCYGYLSDFTLVRD
jgi:hypothetical protein